MNLDFREPKNIKELEHIFRLRQEVYSEDSLLHNMVASEAIYDIDPFDRHALHFAGFEGENPVACLRMTTTSETHFTEWVKSILEANNIILKPRPEKFPFQLYCSNINWNQKFIDRLEGKKVGEVGKLAIHKNYRKGGLVLNELIQSFIHYCKEEQQFDTGFGSCILPLERYYHRFGFERAEEAVPFIHESLPEAVIMKFDR